LTARIVEPRYSSLTGSLQVLYQSRHEDVFPGREHLRAQVRLKRRTPEKALSAENLPAGGPHAGRLHGCGVRAKRRFGRYRV